MSGSTSYGYDNLDELTSESSSRNGGYSNAFHYDAGQNPTTFRNATIPTANADNQIPRTGTTYDGEGNPATYNSTALTFDPEDRMVSYGTAETNGYGPDDLRAWTTTSSGTTFFLYDGDTPVCELNSSGTVTATNTFGADGLISRNTSANGSTFYAFDNQGSTTQRLNSSGVVQTNAITDAFGAVAGAIATDPYSGYNSQWGYVNDTETGMQLLGHRFYDQAQGRFINRDPIGYDGGINVYGYCGNGTVGWADPSGTQEEDPIDEDPPVDPFVPEGPSQPPLPLPPDFLHRLDPGLYPEPEPEPRPEPGNGRPRGSGGGPGAGKRFGGPTKGGVKGKDCTFCGKGGPSEGDHIIPRSKGGNNSPENIQPACRHCNASKGNGCFPKSPPPNFHGPWPNWGR